MKKNLLLFMLTGTLCLIAGEFILRAVGYIPGQFRYNQWVKHVEQLQCVDGFLADSLGIFKVDTIVTGRLVKEVSETEKSFFGLQQLLYDWKCVSEVAMVHRDHYKLTTNRSEGELSDRYYAIIADQQVSHSDSVLVEYLKNPINSDGFYSIPFDDYRGERKKILLLGDSFTWGHSASDKTNSFSNTLLSRGYLVYNTGISGADVAQYRAVLETYLPKLRPDVVVLNFYMGNDVSFFERQPRAGIPIHFNTNAGNLLSFQGGHYFNDAQAAYDNIMRNMHIPQTSTINTWVAKTVVSTFLWSACVKVGMVDHTYFYAKPRPAEPSCNAAIADMAGLCERSGVRFILSVIPDLKDGKLIGADEIPQLFTGMDHHAPDLTTDLFDPQNRHFNTSGHLAYANYLDSLIRHGK